MTPLVSNIVKSLLRLRGRDNRGYYSYVFDERRTAFDYADRLYDNALYDNETSCFHRDTIFKQIFGRAPRRREELIGHVNPIAGIVDAYQFCLRGNLGEELKTQRDGADLPTDVQNRIELIWRDSRLNLQTEVFQHFAASYGASFLRIESDAEARRARILPFHPKNVIDIEESSSGAITQALLEYDVMTGPLGEDRDVKTYRELLTKDAFERWEVDDEKNTKVSTPNALGVCPLVLVRHRDKGREMNTGAFGALSAWAGSDNLVHMANVRMSQVGLAVSKALWAKWFIAASGSKPNPIDLSGEKVIHVTYSGEDKAPMVKALVEPIDFPGAHAHIDRIMTSLIQRQPEIVLTQLESLSGQSGETIRKLLTPVTARIIDARARYETGLIDAIRQAMSWQMILEGQTRDAADEAYRSGKLDFSFAKRPALPPTADEVIVNARANVADQSEQIGLAAKAASIVPVEEQLKLAGYSDEDAKRLAGQVAQQQARENNQGQPRP